MCTVTAAPQCGLACWAESEMSISQDHEQKSGAEKLGEAQREVSELRVGVIPPVTRSAAEPPQQPRVQSGPDKHTRVRRTRHRARVLGTKSHLQLTIV